ncbi:CelD-like protein [Sphingobium chlorophenolicum L-1]|uniref:CelD-like protein n=1 Tax=Sphingobium chlorophenolicum L-1 TaxID=690566 RepID=F6EW51_SPHCR|nr:GNAT family N-acetyltransferase [Sphingobium chlorophenolicum]AEG48930.1 CelD-like protein [Sphingobium chlorophenolicum L-1]
MLVAREYRSVMEARQALGDALDRAAMSSLFERIEWFESLHAHCFATTEARIFQALEGEHQAWLFLVAPRAGRVSALANWYSFDWGPVFLGPPDWTVRRRLVEVIAQNLLKDSAQVDLYPVTEASDLLLEAFRRAGWFGVRRPMGGRHILDLNGRSFEQYWAQRPGRLRTLISRKGRASRFTLSISDRLTDALWRDYVAVHERSWKQPEANLSFLRALAERESAAGTLRLGFARLEEQPVATQMWTVENGAALIHKLAHDQAFDGASPGSLLSHAMFAQAIDRDHVTTIDYGTGDNGYKTDWMERRETLYRLDFFNPRRASVWLPAARTAISALVG